MSELTRPKIFAILVLLYIENLKVAEKAEALRF